MFALHFSRSQQASQTADPSMILYSQSLIDDPDFVPTAEDASTSTAMAAPSSSSNTAASS